MQQSSKKKFMNLSVKFIT